METSTLMCAKCEPYSSDRFKRYLIQPAQIYLSNKLVVSGEKEDPCPGRRFIIMRRVDIYFKQFPKAENIHLNLNTHCRTNCREKIILYYRTII